MCAGKHEISRCLRAEILADTKISLILRIFKAVVWIIYVFESGIDNTRVSLISISQPAKLLHLLSELMLRFVSPCLYSHISLPGNTWVVDVIYNSDALESVHFVARTRYFDVLSESEILPKKNNFLHLFRVSGPIIHTCEIYIESTIFIISINFCCKH